MSNGIRSCAQSAHETCQRPRCCPKNSNSRNLDAVQYALGRHWTKGRQDFQYLPTTPHPFVFRKPHGLQFKACINVGLGKGVDVAMGRPGIAGCFARACNSVATDVNNSKA